jgi:hypothetical protein
MQARVSVPSQGYSSISRRNTLRARSSHNTICRGLPVSFKLCIPLALQFISTLNVQMVRQEPGTERPQHKAKIVLLGEGEDLYTKCSIQILFCLSPKSAQALRAWAHCPSFRTGEGDNKKC